MPASLLFDLDDIDLGAVALTPEEVGAIIPQAGDMRHLDHLVWVDRQATCALGVKHVREDEFWVPGHIPGQPLLPGVIMIEAGAQLANVLYRLINGGEGGFVGFTRCDDVSFRGQVVPGDTLLLLGKQLESRPRRFISAVQGVVGDTLVFEGRITGMPMAVRRGEG